MVCLPASVSTVTGNTTYGGQTSLAERPLRAWGLAQVIPGPRLHPQEGGREKEGEKSAEGPKITQVRKWCFRGTTGKTEEAEAGRSPCSSRAGSRGRASPPQVLGG